MKLCVVCALKVGYKPEDAKLYYAPGLYKPGTKPDESCEGCGRMALCPEVDPSAPQGRCCDCGKPKENRLWGRCSACQRTVSLAAKKRFDDAVGQLPGPSIRADIAKWASDQRRAAESRSAQRSRFH